MAVSVFTVVIGSPTKSSDGRPSRLLAACRLKLHARPDEEYGAC